MAGPYFKEWRKYRELTQEQVVGRLVDIDDPQIPQTGASLSRLENGKQTYTQRIVEALASVYDCEPDHLIGRNPFKEGEVIDFFRGMQLPDQRKALAVLKALRQVNGQ